MGSDDLLRIKFAAVAASAKEFSERFLESERADNTGLAALAVHLESDIAFGDLCRSLHTLIMTEEPLDGNRWPWPPI